MLGLGSVGGIIGSLAAVPVARRFGEIRSLVATTCLVPLAFLALPLATVTPIADVVMVVVSDFLFGLLIINFAVNSGGIRARVTPAALLGRVVSAGRVVSQGVIPLGSLLAGALAARYGNQTGLFAVVGLAVLAAVVMLGSPLGRLRTLPHTLDADQA